MARLVLEAELSSVGIARHWSVEGCAGQALNGRARDILQLLVTEAVANAVLHGTGPVGVEIICDDGGVHVAVSDTSAAVPVLHRTGPDATGERGVALIESLADSWGIRIALGGTEDAAGAVSDERVGARKVVWFDVLPTESVSSQ